MSLELPNYTIFIQFFLFLGVFGVLKLLVFDPLKKVMEERQKKTVDAFKKAEEVSNEALSLVSTYQEKMERQREEMRAMKEETREKLQNKEKEESENLREELGTFSHEIKEKILNELKKGEELLSREAQELSQEVLRKIVET